MNANNETKTSSTIKPPPSENTLTFRIGWLIGVVGSVLFYIVADWCIWRLAGYSSPIVDLLSWIWEQVRVVF